jgi:tetratricopeptide (TPR) repeat protein
MRTPDLALLLALTAACVHRAPTTDGLVKQQPLPTVPLGAAPPLEAAPLTAPDRTVRFEEVEIRGGPKEQIQISDLNDEELFAIGKAALAAGDNAKAALHFERLADFHPDSPRRVEALHLAGLMLERMRDYAGALGRFAEVMKVAGDSVPGGEARFKAADQYWFLGEYSTAADLLEPLTFATWLPEVRRAEASTKRAICLFSAGRLDESEKALRAVLETLKTDLRDALPDQYLPSQAQFYLAEIYRSHFLLVEIDPTKQTQEKLLKELEYKAQMLLSAQGHYLRCIRLGHPEWATASGYRVGELYQNLYLQLGDSRAPSDLDEDQAQIYREELRKKIKVLLTKAIDAYEKTLATAERVGATNPFVLQTRQDLEKMKTLLLQEDATAKSGEGDATPAAAAAPPDRT